MDWTPNQERVIHGLLEWDDELRPTRTPPSLQDGFVESLRTDLEADLISAVRSLDRGKLVATKWDLTSVLKCEGFFLSPDEFVWTGPKVRGTVTHRAIQISLTGRGTSAEPMELVQRVIDAFMAQENDSISDFFKAADEGTISDIVSASALDVTNFQADWPPIRPNMTPRIESPINVPLCDGRIVLRGKYDIALGRPGRDPVVITDLKTGIEQSEHRDEARYYALLETLRNGVAPLRVASYYLDAGVARAQDVNEDLLLAAARRTSVAVSAIADLWHRVRDPVLTAGPQCRYCPVRTECEVGIAWLDEQAIAERA